MKSRSDNHIRYTLVSKGLVRPHYPKVDQHPGHPIAVRRVDDRPATRVVPVAYKRSVNHV
jgi:hypothetical protein